MQPEAAVHQAREHADLGPAKQLAGELGRAVGAREPAQLAARAAAGAVGPLRRRGVEGLAAIVGAAQLPQQGLGTLAQALHVHARGDGKEHMARARALALHGLCGVGRVVAAASLFRGLGHLQLAVEQLLDGGGRGRAGRAVGAGGVAGRQQARALRLLAQQLGARALAQRLGRQPLAVGVQRHAVDAGDGGWGHHGHGVLLF